MLKDLVKQNRSYRSFDGSFEITRETLLDLVDCARFTPSSINMQPFQYFLSYKPETNDIIYPLTAWARLLPGFEGPAEGHRPTAYIIVCTDTTIGPETRFRTDVGIVSQTIMLAAVEKGFGGCMIGNYNPKKVSEALNLPENLVPSLILALGKPDETIIMTELEKGGNARYYRDENGQHYVPKRKLEDITFG